MSASIVDDFRHRVAEAEALRSRLDRLELDRDSELGRILRRRRADEAHSPAGLRPHPSTAHSPISPSLTRSHGSPGRDIYTEDGYRASWTATSPLSSGLDSLGSPSPSPSSAGWHSRSPASRPRSLPGSDIFAERSGLNEDPSPPRWNDATIPPRGAMNPRLDPDARERRSRQSSHHHHDDDDDDARWDIAPRPDRDDRARHLEPSPRRPNRGKKSTTARRTPSLSSLLRRTTESHLSTWEPVESAPASIDPGGERPIGPRSPGRRVKPRWKHAGGPARPTGPALSSLTTPRDVDPVVDALERRMGLVPGFSPGESSPTANAALHDPIRNGPRRRPPSAFATRRRERTSVAALGRCRPPDRLTFSCAMKATEKWETARAREAAEKAAEEEANKRRLFPGGARGRLDGDGSPPGRNGRRNGREEHERRRGGGVEGAVVGGFSPRFFPGPSKRGLMPPFFRSPGADVDGSPKGSPKGSPSPAAIGAGLERAELGYGWKTTPESSEWMSPTKRST